MNVGDKAPDFTLFSDGKEPVTLSEKLADGPVVLLFFPAAFTGVCTTELNEVTNDQEAYAPAQVFGVSTDTLMTQAEFSKVNSFGFPLLSDHSATVSASFGCKYNGDFGPMKYDRIAKRSAFVIDTDGVVRYAEILENPGNMPDLDAVKAAIAAL